MIPGIGWRTALATACLIVTLAAVLAAVVLTISTVDAGGSANAAIALVPSSLGAAYAVVGWIVASRRSRNPIGWVFLGIGFWGAIEGLSASGATYGLTVRPGAIPLAAELAWVSVWAWAPALSLLVTFSLLLFPDGRLPSRRWRPAAWAVVVMIVLLVLPVAITTWPIRGAGLLAGAESPPLQIVGFLMFPVLAVASIGSIVLRFRRSTGRDRQQLKWFTFAAFLEIGLIVVVVVAESVAASGSNVTPLIMVFAVVLVMPLLPATIGLAIFRYRLYDIDRIISRTIGWLVMSAILGTVFVLVIVGLQAILAGLTANNTVAVAASTLVVAALFAPVRTRVQRAVDQRFQRARYDADQTAAAFAAHLRQVVDLETLRSELGTVIAGTLQPSSVRVWVRHASAKASHGMHGADDHATHP